MKIETKKCPKCQREKPLEDFSNNKKRPDGKAFYCKSCYKQSAAEYREKNRSELARLKREQYKNPSFRKKALERQRAWKEKNPDYFREYHKRNKIGFSKFNSVDMIPNNSFKELVIKDVHRTLYLNADAGTEGHVTTLWKDYLGQCKKESVPYLEALKRIVKRRRIIEPSRILSITHVPSFNDGKYLLLSENEWACFQSAVWSTALTPISFEVFLKAERT